MSGRPPLNVNENVNDTTLRLGEYQPLLNAFTNPMIERSTTNIQNGFNTIVNNITTFCRLIYILVAFLIVGLCFSIACNIYMTYVASHFDRSLQIILANTTNSEDMYHKVNGIVNYVCQYIANC